MSITNFTVEEINLIAIYLCDTRAATVTEIAAALPDMDEDIREIAESASRKLDELTVPEFMSLSFAPADDTDEGEAVGEYEAEAGAGDNYEGERHV